MIRSVLRTLQRGRYAAAIVAGAALAAAGCRHAPSASQYPAAVQVVDSAYGPEALSASIDGKRLSDWVPFGQTSGFYGLDPGNYAVGMTLEYRSSPSVSLGASSLAVDNARRYTAIAYGGSVASPEGGGRVALFDVPRLGRSEQRQAAASGRAQVQVFNAAVGAPRVDVLVNSIVAFRSVPYGHRSATIPLAALPYEWTVKPAGDSVDDYAQPVTLQLESGHEYVVVIMGSVADNDLQIKAFEA